MVWMLLICGTAWLGATEAAPAAACEADDAKMFKSVEELAGPSDVDTCIGQRPFVLRRAVWEKEGGADCSRLLSGSPGELLRVLGDGTIVSDLCTSSDDAGLGAKDLGVGTTLREALQRGAAGEPLYYTMTLPLGSVVAATASCGGGLPGRLDNRAWIRCLGPVFAKQLGEATGFSCELITTAFPILNCSALNIYAAIAAGQNLFVGAAGTGMQMHRDMLAANVWAVQQSGRKQFVFCPEELARVVAASDGTVLVDAFNASSWSNANLPVPFDPSACRHVELSAGDLVSWPSRWLHQSLNSKAVRHPPPLQPPPSPPPPFEELPSRVGLLSVAASSFSLDANSVEHFFESVSQYLTISAELEPLVAKMKGCREQLPT